MMKPRAEEPMAMASQLVFPEEEPWEEEWPDIVKWGLEVKIGSKDCVVELMLSFVERMLFCGDVDDCWIVDSSVEVDARAVWIV